MTRPGPRPAFAPILAFAALAGACATPPDPLDYPVGDDDTPAGDDDSTPPPEVCGDGVDNDLDGASDCADADCDLDPGCAAQCLSAGALRCGDVVSAASSDFLATDAVDGWACAAGAFTGPELGFTFDADLDGEVGFRLVADAELALFVLPADSPCDGGTCVGGGSEAVVDVAAGETWRIIVDGAGGAAGHFTLSVDCDESVAEDCADGADNDLDGEVDCHDPDCSGAVPCQEEVCGDGADNDGDGLADCDDPGCASQPDCLDEDCGDGADNDEDGLADCADPDCETDPTCHPENCGNGIDDDADGFGDCADPDCADAPECGGGGGDGAPCTPDYDLACHTSDPWNTTYPGSTDSIDAYACSTWSETGREYAYRFVAPADVEVTASLSGLTADLDIFVLGGDGGCDSGACATYGDSEVSFLAAEGETYYVVVDGYLGAAGPYTLDLVCEGAPEVCGNGADDDGDGLADCDDPDCASDPVCDEPVRCLPELTLSCDQYDQWSNDGAGSTDAVDTWPCSPWDESGPEYAYWFVPDRDAVATVTLTGLSEDLDLAVLDGTGGVCDPEACLGMVDSGAAFLVEEGEVFVLVVDGYQGAVSDYRLTVYCD